jgi:hypothetical protein
MQECDPNIQNIIPIIWLMRCSSGWETSDSHKVFDETECIAIGQSGSERKVGCGPDFKKLGPRGVRPPPRYGIKKTIFSHRSRKFPNPCSTHTQRHRSTREIRLALDLCFGVRHTMRFFYNSKLLGGPSGRSTTAHMCAYWENMQARFWKLGSFFICAVRLGKVQIN